MMDFKYKDLDADTLFDFCEVLNAMGVESIINVFNKDEIMAMQTAGTDTKSIGVVLAMKIAGVLVKNLGNARSEIYNFFANAMIWEDGSQVMVDELRKFKPALFVKVVVDFFTRDDMTDFFKEVAELLGMEADDLKN